MPKISFSFITLFPDLIKNYLSESLLFKAEQKNILKFDVKNLRDFANNKHKSVDDTVYGGADGMVLSIEPLVSCLEAVKKDIPTGHCTKVIYLSPQGKKCDHKKICELATYDHLVFICGRYAGVDQRFIANYVDEELSIGDYILSGGELASLVVTESVSRQVEGVLGDQKSAEQDSFSESLNGLLEAPQFTKPQSFNGLSVPEVLSGGHHQKISEWQSHVSILVTLAKRPELLEKKYMINWLLVSEYYKNMSESDKKILGLLNLEQKIKDKNSVCAFKG